MQPLLTMGRPVRRRGKRRSDRQFSRVFEFSPRCFFHLCSITTSSTSGSPGEQASHERPGTVCMGSWTQCTDARAGCRRASGGRKRSVRYVWAVVTHFRILHTGRS
jgi:hypothetical protein